MAKNRIYGWPLGGLLAVVFGWGVVALIIWLISLMF